MTSNIKLLQPTHKGNISLEEALHKRQSVRSYNKKPLTLQEISQILWAAQGIKNTQRQRTTPSAGGLYPLKVYVVAENIINLPKGIYNYIPEKNTLKQTASGSFSEKLSEAALKQKCVADAAANIVITAEHTITNRVYGERGRRYVYMEAGHASENIYLQCESLGLGTVSVGAFNDSEVKTI